jgi:hypothetical protein
MIKLQTGRLAFDLAIFGGAASTIEPRVVIQHGDIEYSIKAVKEDSQWVANIPRNILKEEEEVDARIDVVIDGQIFTPFKSKIMLEKFTLPKVKISVDKETTKGRLQTLISDVIKSGADQ